MTKKITLRQFVVLLPFMLGLIFAAIFIPTPVNAQVENPQDGSVALEGTISTDPPSQGATISFPTNGQTFTDTPITVTGVCPGDLLVKLFKNEVFAGSAVCENGSFSITIDLFSGRNTLVARVFDSLDQPGPDSNTVNVTFDDGSQQEALQRVTLTTNFSKRGAFPGETLTWPLLISNGTPPYAVSVDWGDGKTSLVSVQFPGEFVIDHEYEKPGTYAVIIKATDSDGDTAYLQVVAVINGPVAQRADDGSGGVTSEDGTADGSISQRTITRVLIWPLYILLGLIVFSFWFGKRYAIKQLRKRLANDQPIFK